MCCLTRHIEAQSSFLGQAAQGTNLGCRFDNIWNQLEHMWRVFLAGSFEVERPTLNLGHTFQWQSTWKKETFAFCLPALTLSDKFIYPAVETFLFWCRNFFRISIWTKDQLRNPASWTKQHPQNSCPFLWETAIVGLAGPHPVSHSNKSHMYMYVHTHTHIENTCFSPHSISSVPLETSN